MKKILPTWFELLSIIISFITFISFPPITWAAGEQYSWVNNGSLQITGGNLANPVTLPPPRLTIGNQSQYMGTVVIRNGQSECDLSVTIIVTNNPNSGQLLAKPTVSVGATRPACSSEIAAQYNNTTITISGNRDSGAAETDDQKTVQIGIFSPDATTAPSSLTIKVGTQSKTVTKNIEPESGSAQYSTSFLVEPGTWQACAPPLVTCQSFTKVKYQKKILTFGEMATSLDIKLTVTIAGFSQQSCSIGPYDVVLKQNEKIIQTVKSTSATTAPPNGSGNTFGSETVDTTANLEAKFTKVIPGNYQVCAPRLNVCTNYTYDKGVIKPQVDLKGNESDSASLCLAPGETPQPLPAVPPPPCAPGKLVNNAVCTGFLTAFGEINTDASNFLLELFAMGLAISGGLALLLFMRAGYIILTSAGNGEQVKKGREQLVAAIVGLLFIIFSFVILQVIGVEILRLPDFSSPEAGVVAPGGTCQPGRDRCTNGYVCNYNNGTGQCVKPASTQSSSDHCTSCETADACRARGGSSRGALDCTPGQVCCE